MKKKTRWKVRRVYKGRRIGLVLVNGEPFLWDEIADKPLAGFEALDSMCIESEGMIAEIREHK